MKLSKPVYIVEPGDPVIVDFENVICNIPDPEAHSLVLDISPAMLQQVDASMVHQLVMALQHYPHLIHALLFGVEFRFVRQSHSHTDEIVARWFQALARFPAMLYFIQDENARLMALTGLPRGKSSNFTPIQWQRIHQKVFAASVAIEEFCCGSGFNPEVYVQGMLAFYDCPQTYRDVQHALG